MKAVVFSDSHGNSQNMMEIMQTEAPDMCIFLGDGYRDILAVQKAYLVCDYHIVCGNCDRGEAPLQLCIPLGNGYRAFVCHGHEYSVKFGLMRLQYAALEQNADVALYGHTHCARLEQVGPLRLLNPGSVGRGFYAIIETDAEGLHLTLKSSVT